MPNTQLDFCFTPGADAQRLMKLLREAGAEVSMQWHPGGHSISDDQLAAARDWLPHVLEKEKEYAKG